MRNKLVAFGSLFLLALPFLFASRKRSPVTSGGPVRGSARSVALVGDSLAVGIAPHLRRLVEASGASLYGDTEGGTGVVQWPSARVALVPNDAVVFVSLGGNDRQRTWATDLPAQIERFAADMGERPWHWLDTPFPTLPDRMGVSDAWRAAAERHGGHVLDVGTAEELAAVRASDGVHLTPAGYAALASVLWDEARAWLATRARTP